MKFKKTFAALLVGAMILTGCSSKPDEKKETKTEEKKENTKKPIKYAMVTDTGGVNDQSFNQSAYEGLKELQKEGIIEKPTYVESKQASDYKTNLETLLDGKNDLIAGIGFALAKDIEAAAKANPDQKYVIIDSSFENTPKNLIGTIFADNENSFLVGYLAGALTTSNKVGFIGGITSPLIKKFEAGFRAGVEQAAKDNNKKVEVVAQYAESFGDATKGKAIANSMYSSGVDMIFHASGGTGNGVIESAKENKKFVFGVDRDQSYLAPEYVIASTIKKVNEAIKSVGKDLYEGKFRGGETIEFSLKTNGVDVAYGKEDQLKIKIPNELKQKIEELKKSIADGKITVPTEVK